MLKLLTTSVFDIEGGVWCLSWLNPNFPRKGEGDWKHQHLSQHSTIRQHSVLIYLHYALWELWLCYAALFTSVQHLRLVQTWNIALILINLNWINEIIIGNSLATWMQWWNLRNIRLMFYFSSLILTFLCSWTHVWFFFFHSVLQHTQYINMLPKCKQFIFIAQQMLTRSKW